MGPVLSIIVPVFNVRSFLDKCVDSILAQTFTDFELIIVDDGSTDGSEEICDNYARMDRRINVIHKQNKGVVNARKAGLSAASGKYVGYVDGDDWIEPDMYENLIKYMEEYDCDLVMCDVIHESRSLPFSSGSASMNIDGGYYSRAAIEQKIFPSMIYAGEFFKFGIYPVIWNKLYKREKLMKYQMAVDDNIKTGEDAACVYPYIYDSDSLYFIKNVSLYHYRYSQNQMTKAYDDSHFEHFKSLYNFLSKSDIASSPYAYQLDYYYSYLTKIAVGNELRRDNRVPPRKKLENIKEIASFAAKKGYLENIEINSFTHRLYFDLLKGSRPFPLMLGIYAVRLVQRLFGRGTN